MLDIDSIASETIQTLEDLISGLFCVCDHLLDEHFMGQCGGLDFNGTVWSACRCKNARTAPFEIKLNVEITENHHTNKTELFARKVA